MTERSKPPRRLYVLKFICFITGYYPCAKCRKYFKRRDWVKWQGEEPSVWLLWSGPLCLDCFSEGSTDRYGYDFRELRRTIEK